MIPRKLDKTEWRAYCDLVSRGLAGKRAEIEIVSLDLGNQVEAKWLPLLGIVYDPKNDIIEVALEGLDHMIRKPREVYVDDDQGELASLEIIDSDGVRQIINLRDPLMLPPPSAAASGQRR